MRKPKRDPKTGEFARKDDAFYGTYVDGKGYISICAGPFRGMRLHTLIAIAMEGRKLRKDEDVHHKGPNPDKLNPCPVCSIVVMGHKEHGCVSAKQHHYVKTHDIHLKNEWDEFFEGEA
jgi:hypothetical protein